MNIRIRLIGMIMILAMLLPGCGTDKKQNEGGSYSTPFEGTPTGLPKTGDTKRDAYDKEEVPEATTVPEETEGVGKTIKQEEDTARTEETVPSRQANAKKEDYIVVKITHIDWKYFMAEAPWKSSIKYIIHAELGDRYCKGDYVEVSYKDIYELENNQYEVDAIEVSDSSYVSQKDVDYKPVIYLYPKKEETVSVKLEYDGAITVSSPEYKNGWVVTAKPDGTLVGDDGKDYKYIFWEGIREMSYDLSKGFCVKGSKTREFLEEKLRYMGLNQKETKEFIKFWIPYMKGNAYNLISFQGKEYTDHAKLMITPKPDSMLRVYMVFKPLQAPIEVEEQKLVPFKRTGFTVVEWGGTIQ